MLAMGPRDLNSAPYGPVHCSSHSMTSFQSSELTELPVVENSQLFAQRTVRPHMALMPWPSETCRSPTPTPHRACRKSRRIHRNRSRSHPHSECRRCRSALYRRAVRWMRPPRVRPMAPPHDEPPPSRPPQPPSCKRSKTLRLPYLDNSWAPGPAESCWRLLHPDFKEKKKVFLNGSFSKKAACSSYVEPWLVAVGGWRQLVAVGSGWRLVAAGGWRLVAPWGGP